MSQNRRSFLRNTGIGLLSFYVAGCEVEMSPEEARQRQIPYNILSDSEVETLESFGEVLLQGSPASGLAHFVDHQLGASAEDQLLMIRYLGVTPPFAAFYRAGLAALNETARALHGQSFAELEHAVQIGLVGLIAQSNPDAWEGPPAPLFYFVLRNDAVDVVYGTQNGFKSLDIPYMAHIVPPSRWGE